MTRRRDADLFETEPDQFARPGTEARNRGSPLASARTGSHQRALGAEREAATDVVARLGRRVVIAVKVARTPPVTTWSSIGARWMISNRRLGAHPDERVDVHRADEAGLLGAHRDGLEGPQDPRA